jgi:hypothetical protein
MNRRFIGYILAALIPCAAHAQSALAPCNGQSSDDYFAGVNRITDRAVKQPFQLQLTTLPSFQSESVLRLAGSEIYLVQFRKFYWAEANSLDRSGAMRKDFSKTQIPVKVRHAPLSGELAQRVLQAYLAAMASAKSTEQMGVDGVSYIFTTPDKACAQAWSPAPDSHNGRLIELLTLLEKHAGYTAPADLQKSELAITQLLAKLPVEGQPGKPPALTELEIQSAIKEALAEEPAPKIPDRAKSGVYGTSAYVEQRMTRAFNEAKVPDCLHPDATKFTPPQLGPVILTGEFAAPFWAYAALTGKCR